MHQFQAFDGAFAISLDASFTPWSHACRRGDRNGGQKSSAAYPSKPPSPAILSVGSVAICEKAQWFRQRAFYPAFAVSLMQTHPLEHAFPRWWPQWSAASSAADPSIRPSSDNSGVPAPAARRATSDDTFATTLAKHPGYHGTPLAAVAIAVWSTALNSGCAANRSIPQLPVARLPQSWVMGPSPLCSQG